jgi:hypothetical protein
MVDYIALNVDDMHTTLNKDLEPLTNIASIVCICGPMINIAVGPKGTAFSKAFSELVPRGIVFEPTEGNSFSLDSYKLIQKALNIGTHSNTRIVTSNGQTTLIVDY